MTIITKTFNRRRSAIRTHRRQYGNGSGCPGWCAAGIKQTLVRNSGAEPQSLDPNKIEGA